jgi:hypothetical protein
VVFVVGIGECLTGIGGIRDFLWGAEVWSMGPSAICGAQRVASLPSTVSMSKPVEE